MHTAVRETAAAPRFDGIDLLRGLSILAVVLLHIEIRFSSAHLILGGRLPSWLFLLLFYNGGNGVTIFFAVSGFLITFTSLRRFGSLAALRPLRFYRIRFARIMPLLLALLAVLSVLHLANASGYRINEKFFTLPRALFAALTFHLNWLEAARNAWLPACWTVLWSLSIEEMFYLFFPLLSLVLFRCGRIGRSLWIVLALALFAVGPWARAIWPRTDLQAENSYLGGMASIAVGCLTALLVERFWRQPPRRAVLVALQALGCAGILLIAFRPRWHMLRVLGKSGTDDSLLALSVCLVMAAVTLRQTGGGGWSAPLRWFGRHSYEVYLTHEFVVIAGVSCLLRLGHGPHWPWAVGIALLTAPLGWAVARLVSEPANRWLRGAPLPEQLPARSLRTRQLVAAADQGKP